MSVYQKLQQARIKLQSVQMKKSGHNKFAGYTYFELADFLNPIQQIFAELGLCGITSFTADMATLRIVDIESGGEVVFTSPMGSAALKGCHEVQNIGAVETYQRRYLYVAALEIVEHDAIDSQPLEAEKPKKKTITPTTGVKDALTERLQHQVEKLAAHIQAQYDSGNEWGAFEAWDLRDDKTFDHDASTAVWSLLSSKVRTTIKAMAEEAKAAA